MAAANRRILVQTQNFNVAAEYDKIAGNDHDGAIVTFAGKVRDHNDHTKVTALTLEHYPAMTEKILNQLVDEACERWPINNVTIIHRVGTLLLGEQIVFIGVSSAHRKAAFAANEFLIDYLKTKAPFWKLETSDKGKQWLKAKDTDEQATKMWR